MNKKALTIVMMIFLLIITIATTSMIEFYYAKDRDRMPLLSIKSESTAKQYIKHSSLFFNVYKCYSGDTFVLSKNSKVPICRRIIKFNEEGYYTNINNLKISKRDYQMIYDVSKTLKEIEEFTTSKEIDDAVKVAEEYERSLHIPLKTIQINKEIINIEAYKEFVIINQYGDYAWQYQRTNETYYKCFKKELYKQYKSGSCLGEWTEVKLSQEWCSLAKGNTITSIEDAYTKYCK